MVHLRFNPLEAAFPIRTPTSFFERRDKENLIRLKNASETGFKPALQVGQTSRTVHGWRRTDSSTRSV